jgi:hypothetical protein
MGHSSTADKRDARTAHADELDLDSLELVKSRAQEVIERSRREIAQLKLDIEVSPRTIHNSLRILSRLDLQ